MKCRDCKTPMQVNGSVQMCGECGYSALLLDAALVTAPIPLPKRWKVEPPTPAELSPWEDAS